jgi:heterodisulfide reductase subunit B
VPVEPLLDKMGIPYDPSRKFLGKNGEYLGIPEEPTALKFHH